MTNLPKIALGAWAWGNDGTFGNALTAENLKPVFDTAMANLPKIALGAWAWGNDGTFGNNLTAESLKLSSDSGKRR